MKFDIIVGNPPFQKNDNCYGTNLWADFVIIGFNLTNQYLLMITPKTWINTVIKKTKNKQVYNMIIQYGTIVNIDKCSQYFEGIGSSFSYYVINKKTIDDYILINDLKIKRSKLNIIPKDINNISIKIVNNLINLKCLKYYTSSGYAGKVSKIKDNIYKYPITITNNAIIYCDTLHRYQYTPKLIFPNQTTVNYPIYGPTSAPANRGVFYKVKNEHEAKSMLSYIKSKLIQFLISQQRTHHGLLNTMVITRIPKIDISRTWTDDALYEHFNLTSEEIKYINEI